MTDFELTTPPDDQWVKDVCRIGQGATCCRFLTMSPEGWSCEKHGEHSALLTHRAACGQMTAIADNCAGRISR